MSIEQILTESLRPVSAPAGLWDRVWQPRIEVPRQRVHAFAFSLPVLAATALVVMVASTAPLRQGQPGIAATPAAPVRDARPAAAIVSNLERRETVNALSRTAARPDREGGSRMDAAACSLCHTL